MQARDGGEAIPPVVARIFSGDSTSPLTRDGHGCPKLNAQSFARMRNQQSVHKGAWMPEVERPEFRKDAKPTERSYGKSDSVFRGVVRFWEGWSGRKGGGAFKRVVGGGTVK